MMKKRINNISILIFIVASIISAAEFYIIENPSALIIYDKYEAREEDKDIFLPYSPFEIIEKSATLGDGISEVMKVTYIGETYYILKDDNGKIEGLSEAGSIKKITASTYSDTLSSIGSVIVKEGFYPGKKNVSSLFNQNSVAVLKYKGYLYLINNKKTVFGWSNSHNWKKVKRESTKIQKTEVSDDQFSKLTNKIKEINELYKKTFNYYNEKLNESKGVPYWKIEKEGKVINFKLRGSKASIVQLEESSQYIVQEFLNILLGDPFDVKYRDGQITVSPEDML